MPYTLEGISEFHSGIGSGNDLKVSVSESPDGHWYPELEPGYFYINDTESYLYANVGVVNPTWSAGTVVSTSVALSYDPTVLGPIRVTRASNGDVLRRISSPLLPFQECSFSTSGSYKYAPVTGVLISVVSDPKNGSYLGVLKPSDIYSRNDYYYDADNSRFFIADDNPPSIFATSVVSSSQSSMLRQNEIVVVDKDGKIRTQLSPIMYASGVVVTKPTASGAVIVSSGMAVTNNVVTLPSGTTITSGDLVSVSYNITDSFCAEYNGTHLVVSGIVATSGVYRIEYETSDSTYKVSNLAPYHLSRIDLNPILESQRSSYLYLCDEDLSFNDPYYINVKLESENLVYSEWYRPPILVEIEVLDKNLDPIPRQQVIVSGDIAGYPAYISRSDTNWQGKVLVLIKPVRSGLLTLNISLDGSTLTETRVITIASLEEKLTAIDNLCKVLLTLSDIPDAQGRLVLSAQLLKIDGAPYQAGNTEVQTLPSRYEITFACGNSEITLLDGRRVGNNTLVVTDTYGVASVYVTVKAGDILRSHVNILNKTIYSNSILIPEDTYSVSTLESATII